MSGSGDETLPNEFSLHQNYPNPFDAETRVSFGVPESARVHLNLFNLNGQHHHFVIWNATQQPAGVYFIEM